MNEKAKLLIKIFTIIMSGSLLVVFNSNSVVGAKLLETGTPSATASATASAATLKLISMSPVKTGGAVVTGSSLSCNPGLGVSANYFHCSGWVSGNDSSAYVGGTVYGQYRFQEMLTGVGIVRPLYALYIIQNAGAGTEAWSTWNWFGGSGTSSLYTNNLIIPSSSSSVDIFSIGNYSQPARVGPWTLNFNLYVSVAPISGTPTSMASPSPLPTITPTPTATDTRTPTNTHTPVASLTSTPTLTPTSTATSTPTLTPTSTATSTQTSTPTNTPIPSWYVGNDSPDAYGVKADISAPMQAPYLENVLSSGESNWVSIPAPYWLQTGWRYYYDWSGATPYIEWKMNFPPHGENAYGIYNYRNDLQAWGTTIEYQVWYSNTVWCAQVGNNMRVCKDVGVSPPRFVYAHSEVHASLLNELDVTFSNVYYMDAGGIWHLFDQDFFRIEAPYNIDELYYHQFRNYGP